MLLKMRYLITPLVKGTKNNVCAAFISTSLISTSISKPTEEKIQVGKYNINYLKVGTGSHQVLCLPGALGTIWTDFKPQVKGLDRDKFTVVTWEPPGYGKSRPPEKKFGKDMFERDADTAYDFMQALNIPKYSVLGWSDGGITGMIHAAKYPNAVKKLIVWATHSFVLPQELKAYRQMRDIKNWSKEMRDPMIEIYGEEKLRKYWSEWVDTRNHLYNKNKGNVCAEFLKDIKSPTFILYGEKDPLVDKSHVSYLHTHIERSRIHLYPEGKHNIHIKYAEDFNRKVEEFLIQP